MECGFPAWGDEHSANRSKDRLWWVKHSRKRAAPQLRHHR